MQVWLTSNHFCDELSGTIFVICQEQFKTPNKMAETKENDKKTKRKCSSVMWCECWKRFPLKLICSLNKKWKEKNPKIFPFSLGMQRFLDLHFFWWAETKGARDRFYSIFFSANIVDRLSVKLGWTFSAITNFNSLKSSKANQKHKFSLLIHQKYMGERSQCKSDGRAHTRTVPSYWWENS